MQHHHRTMVNRESPEAALELVAIDDRAQAIRSHRLVSRQEMEVGRRATYPASLCVAGAHQKPVRPGVKARRVTELWEVPPDGQQRLLRCVLGEIGVPQDPVRHRMESVAGGNGKACKCLFVALLRPYHEFGIDASSVQDADSDRHLHRVWAYRERGRLNLKNSALTATVVPWHSITILFWKERVIDGD